MKGDDSSRDAAGVFVASGFSLLMALMSSGSDFASDDLEL